MFRALDLSPDILAAHGRAMRGLARSLIGESDADDVVQETWLACLKHPGAVPERLSAWLGTVTRRLALRRRRGEGRRRARELRTAAPERLEALELRALEREEALRAVTQALLALEEPCKSALLLRYYEDRAPAEIAAELGLPLATVKSRLARGLERLRAKLGSELSGDERRIDRALCALAALPAPAPLIVSPAATAAGSAASATGALLGAKLAAAAATVVLASGGLAWWQRGEQESGERVRAQVPAPFALPVAHSVATAPAQEETPQAGAGTASRDGAQREPVAAPASESASAPAFPAETAHPYRIRGQVRDERDLPLAGARVFLGPRRFPLNRVAVTDDEGRFELDFDGRRPSMTCAFTVDDGHGRALGLRELALVSGRELVVDVGLWPFSRDERKLVELRAAERAAVALDVAEAGTSHETLPRFEGGLSLEGARATEVLRVVDELLKTRVAALETDPLDRAPESARRSDGHSVFVQTPPSGACERPRRAFGSALGIEFMRASRVELELDGLEVLQTLEGGLDQPRPPAIVRGIVRDALGRPVAGAEVGWGSAGRTLESSVHSGADGAFVLAGIPPGELVLRAGGGDHGVARTAVTLASGQELVWDPLLDRGDEVSGRVLLGEDGKPLAGALVELWSASATSLWRDSTVTDSAGRFAIPNVPAGSFELFVHAAGASAFPARVVRPVFAGAGVGDLVLGAEELRSSAFALAVLDPDGHPLPGAEVRLWQASTGRGVFAGPPDEEGRLTLAGLPHGPFRVEAGGPFGWRDLGTVWIEEDVELATERFARTGFAQLRAVEHAEAPSALVSSLWSAHPDVFGRMDHRELEHAVLPLTAGRYVLCSAAGRGAATETELDVRAGEVTSLVLEVSPSNAVTVREDAQGFTLDTLGTDTSCSSCHALAEAR